MKKKLISIILLIVLCLALVLTCAACWDLTPPTNNGDATDNTGENNNNSTDSNPNDTANNNPGNNPSGDPNGNDTPVTPPDEEEDPFNDYGMNVITVELNNVNVKEDGIYNTMQEVGAYIHLYNRLPSNYTDNKNDAKNLHTAANKLSYGGAKFNNREGLLPYAQGRTFTECDIGYEGGGRNALRIVFSSDGLVFYTDDHYASFSILRFV